MSIGAALALGLAVASLPGTFELALLTLGALLGRWREGRADAARGAGAAEPFRLVVVVPAHDEQERIGACLASLEAASTPLVESRILVVADNCADATARAAAEAGAEVIERNDPLRPGKGQALAFAFERLDMSRLDAIACVDADSRVAPSFFTELAAAFGDGADAVQVTYTVAGPTASTRARLQCLALAASNELRPRGRAFWGLSAGILGNGFAVSRQTIAAVPFQAGSIVEDLEYHLALVRAGKLVRYLDSTEVQAELPGRPAAFAAQKARWEGGRLRMLREHAPGLVAEVVRGRWRLVEPLLDLLLLPLSYHGLLLAACALPAFAPTRAAAAVGLGVVATHALAACLLARPRPGLLALALLPLYAGWKLALLPRILLASRRRAPWVRTDRSRP